MSGTKHPAIESGCTKAQIEAFDLIAVGQTGGHAWRTLDALERKGLICFTEHNEPLRSGAVFMWREPFVPMHLHMEWCGWCAENVPDSEGDY